MSPKQDTEILTIKKNNNKLRLNKFRRFYFPKDTPKRIKRQTTSWKKTLGKDIQQ